MTLEKILIVLGSASDLPITEGGMQILADAKVNAELRIASAHRSSEFLHQLTEQFERENGSLYICVAGKSAHLAGVVAAATIKPVLAVPVYNPETAGFDALLSMCQMPKGTPVATMGFGKAGFSNACLFALQILGISNPQRRVFMEREKQLMAEEVIKSDAAGRRELTFA